MGRHDDGLCRHADPFRRRLEIIVDAHARLDRAFVTDTTGLLWVDFPPAPESLDRRFDDRDWFAGVSGGPGAYVSEVYRCNAEPSIQVVAPAAPVLLQDRRYDEYAGVLPSPAPAPGAVVKGRYTDPLSGETMLASSVGTRVSDHEWTVVSQQPIRAAFAPIRGLTIRLGAAGLLMVGLMGGLLWGVGRENARRRKAEGDLLIMNEEPERRVEERTAALEEKEDHLIQARKMEAVGWFAGGWSTAGSPEWREVQDVRRAAERAAELTRQLLAFSRKTSIWSGASARGSIR